MDRSSETQLVQRLWSEHKYALIARSPTKARELGRRMAVDSLNATAAAEAIEELMSEPENYLSEALLDAWAHLQPRVGVAARKVVEGLLEQDLELARWVIGGLAESVGDGLVASSRMLDYQGACRRIWLRDKYGPTLFEILPSGLSRMPPAEIGSLFVAKFGDISWKIFRAITKNPCPSFDIGERYGDAGLRVLEAGYRLLIFRCVGGIYRSRGTAVSLVLAGLGR